MVEDSLWITHWPRNSSGNDPANRCRGRGSNPRVGRQFSRRVGLHHRRKAELATAAMGASRAAGSSLWDVPLFRLDTVFTRFVSATLG